jgi:3-deoxy-7-phosphoheptulonate synthase
MQATELLTVSEEIITEMPCCIKSDVPLVHRKNNTDKTLINVRGTIIGGDKIIVMAGPCAVESMDQIMATADAVKKEGAAFLRGGAYKPRTSPYSFQGLGIQGLKILAEGRKRCGLPIVTEVVDPQLVDVVSSYADILQVGARNMQNFALLKAVGKCKKPVLLKRGLMSTIQEFLNAAEYILSEGNPNVILCERGIRTFETATRNTLDISAIPILKQQTHLPVFVDPSHATGVRELIIPVSRAAIAAGADGIIVEVHPNPGQALSDGPQSLDLQEFSNFMHSLRPIVFAMDRTL